MAEYDVNALTKLGHLKSLADRLHTQVEAVNASIESVNSSIPINVSQLNNDSGFQTATQVNSAVTKGIDDWAKNVTENETIDTFKEIVDYIAEHQGEATELMTDVTQLQTNVSALQEAVGDEPIKTQIANAISEYNTNTAAKTYATQTTVSGINTRLGTAETKLATVAEGATKVAASTNNGYIKINGVETLVYSLPANVITGTIASDTDVANMITEVFGE